MVGRNRIQIFGFLGVGVLFMVSAGAYGPLTTEGGIGTFQFIYFFSSFVVSLSRRLYCFRQQSRSLFTSGPQACAQAKSSLGVSNLFMVSAVVYTFIRIQGGIGSFPNICSSSQIIVFCLCSLYVPSMDTLRYAA